MSRNLLGLIPALLIVLAACNPSTTESTADADSLAMMADTTTAQDVYGDDEESGEDAGADTTLLTEIKSAFKGPQFDRKIAYVYRKGGLPIYESLDDTNDDTKDRYHLPFGEKVVLLEPLINNQPSDKITIDGLKGRYVAINVKGVTSYIFSGYLTNFPVRQSEDLVDYFGKNLHLVSTPVKITSKTMFETTPEWWKTSYTFESDLIVDDNGYYEGASTSITLPASCTMQEGFLLLKSLPGMTAFDSLYSVYPERGFSKSLDEYRSGSVESNDQEGITKIMFEDNSGCSDETFVQKLDGRIVIGRGGGC